MGLSLAKFSWGDHRSDARSRGMKSRVGRSGRWFDGVTYSQRVEQPKRAQILSANADTDQLRHCGSG